MAKHSPHRALRRVWQRSPPTHFGSPCFQPSCPSAQLSPHRVSPCLSSYRTASPAPCRPPSVHAGRSLRVARGEGRGRAGGRSRDWPTGLTPGEPIVPSSPSLHTPTTAVCACLCPAAHAQFGARTGGARTWTSATCTPSTCSRPRPWPCRPPTAASWRPWRTAWGGLLGRDHGRQALRPPGCGRGRVRPANHERPGRVVGTASLRSLLRLAAPQARYRGQGRRLAKATG